MGKVKAVMFQPTCKGKSGKCLSMILTVCIYWQLKQGLFCVQGSHA